MARKEYLEHIKQCPLYDGWQQVFDYIKANNIQAAIVSGNNREVLNVAVSTFGLQEIFPKDKINGQIGRGFLVLLGVGPNDTHESLQNSKITVKMNTTTRIPIVLRSGNHAVLVDTGNNCAHSKFLLKR